MPKYYLWDDPFSYTLATFDFYFIFFQVMLRFIKFMKVILFLLGRNTLNSAIYVKINQN